MRDFMSCCGSDRIETPLCRCQSAQSNKWFRFFSKRNISLIQSTIYTSTKRTTYMLVLSVLPSDKHVRLHSLSYANIAEAALWRKDLKANDSQDIEVLFSIRKMLLLFSAFESIMQRCWTHPAWEDMQIRYKHDTFTSSAKYLIVIFLFFCILTQ